MKLIIELDLDAVSEAPAAEASRILRYWAGAVAQMDLTSETGHPLMNAAYDTQWDACDSCTLATPRSETRQGRVRIRMAVVERLLDVSFVELQVVSVGGCDRRIGAPRSDCHLGDLCASNFDGLGGCGNVICCESQMCPFTRLFAEGGC